MAVLLTRLTAQNKTYLKGLGLLSLSKYTILLEDNRMFYITFYFECSYGYYSGIGMLRVDTNLFPLITLLASILSIQVEGQHGTDQLYDLTYIYSIS